MLLSLFRICFFFLHFVCLIYFMFPLFRVLFIVSFFFLAPLISFSSLFVFSLFLSLASHVTFLSSQLFSNNSGLGVYYVCGPKKCFEVLVESPDRRNRRSWEDNIKMNLQKWDGKTWTGFLCLRIGIVRKRL